MNSESSVIGYLAAGPITPLCNNKTRTSLSSIRRKISQYLSMEEFHAQHIRTFIKQPKVELSHTQNSDLPTYAYDEIHSNYSAAYSELDYTYYAIKSSKIKFYIICYIFVYIFVGTLTAIPSSIFPYVQTQLNITNEQMGLLWSSKDICIGISTIISGAIVDKLQHCGHLYNILFVLSSTIAMCLMSIIYDYYSMMVCWVMIGIVFGVLTCCIPLYIFRLFDNSQDSAVLLNACSLIEAISMAAFTLLVDLSISYLGSYSYAIYLLGIIVVIPMILSLLILPTPCTKQIHSATIETVSELIETKLNPQQSNFKSICLFAALSACLICFYQSQIVAYGAYISIYSVHFIGSTDQKSLYFVTMYFCGIALGRIVAHFSFRRYRADDIILFCVSGMFLSGMCFILMHYAYDNAMININQNVYEMILYFILVSAGMFCAPVYPATMAFLALICPMNGYLTSAVMVGLCVGGSVSAFYIGLYVDMYSAVVIPYCVVIQLFICFVIGILIKILFNKYQQTQLPVDALISFTKSFTINRQ